MDQERDTKDTAKSSRRGRFWLENAANGAQSATPSEPSRDSGSGNRKGFEEISAAEVARVDPAVEPLPTLFELPDRTPEAVQRQRNSNQFAIHNAHSGPPASHVDPPSGNQSRLSQSGPIAPTDSNSVFPVRLPEQHASAPGLAADATGQSTISDENRLAAYKDEPMTWADDTKASSWATRSAIVMLVLMMVTLAFFSGRGSNRTGTPSDDSRLTDAEIDDLGDTVVVITEDFGGDEDYTANETTNTSLASQVPATESNPYQDPPSYVAQSPAPTGSLGEPSAATHSEDELDLDEINGDSTFIAPPDFETNESVVNFRTNDPSLSDPSPSDAAADSDDLPAGMDDRLRLDDGLRYSDTPYAIGNFLEILKAWEASHQP